MARSKTGTASTSPPTKRARKAPPRPATRGEATIDFARNISSRARAKLTAIHKHPTGKKQLTKARLDAFDADIRAAATAMTAHQLQKDGAAAAAANEEKLRLELIEQVREIRDSVGALTNVARDVAHAFGVGKRLSDKTNADALLLAAGQQQAFETEDFAPTAHEAGITEAQISKLVTSRRALSTAATTQSNSVKTRMGKAIDKSAMLQALTKETTAIRRIARIALRGNAAALKAFGPAPKIRRVKRAKKGTAPGTTAATPTTGTAATAQGATTAATNGGTAGTASG